MDLSGSDLYGTNYMNKIISNANLNRISQCFANSSDKIINEIQNMFYSYLWSGKPDKIKRKVIIGQYEEGGLKMPHIESFCHGLKMVWMNKILNTLTITPWKTLFIDQYNKYAAD